MQKNVKRMSKVSVILVFLMMFSSCVKDDFYEKESAANFNGASVKHYDGSQARTLISRFKQGILSSTKFSLSSQEGVVYRTMNEVSISEDEVMEVKDTLGNVNYTFRVEGLSQRGSGEFYNIVINNRDGKERAFLLKYVMDPKFQTEYEAGNSSIEMFRGILFIASLAGNDNPCDENIVVPVVPGTGGGGGGGGHGNGGVGVETGNGSYNNGGGLAYIQEVVYQLAMGSSGCEPPAGGCEEDDIWEDCACWRQVSVSPRFFRIGIFPVLSDTPDPCGDTIGTIGVLPDRNHEKNCEKLKEVADDPALKEALEDLQTKIHEAKEHSYSVTKPNGSSNYGQPVTVPHAPNDPWKIDMPVGGDIVGAFHTHWDPLTGMYPMFTGGDIEFLFYVAQKHASNGVPKNWSEYFLTLTTPNGTYAIKIENVTEFFSTIDSVGIQKIKDDIEDEYKKANPNSELQTTVAFLNALKSSGLKGMSLYKANNNLTNWNKLSLSNSPLQPITQTPCN